MLPLTNLTILKQGLVSLVTMRIIVTVVTLELVLVQEDITITPTRVATRPITKETMETSTSKPWDTSWYSKTNEVSTNQELVLIYNTINVAHKAFDSSNK